MTLTITDTHMTSDGCPNVAELRGRRWIVTGYPGRTFDRNQAITAMLLAELLAQRPFSKDRTELLAATWRAEIGITEADGPHIPTATEEPADQPDEQRSDRASSLTVTWARPHPPRQRPRPRTPRPASQTRCTHHDPPAGQPQPRGRQGPGSVRRPGPREWQGRRHRPPGRRPRGTSATESRRPVRAGHRGQARERGRTGPGRRGRPRRTNPVRPQRTADRAGGQGAQPTANRPAVAALPGGGHRDRQVDRPPLPDVPDTRSPACRCTADD